MLRTMHIDASWYPSARVHIESSENHRLHLKGEPTRNYPRCLPLKRWAIAGERTCPIGHVRRRSPASEREAGLFSLVLYNQVDTTVLLHAGFIMLKTERPILAVTGGFELKG
jgi:hypothetical protein